MANNEQKVGKFTEFFRDHFGSKKGKSNDKPLLAKNKEEASKTSIKKTFKNAFSKVTNPIMKQLLKTNGKDDFEKTLSKIGKTRIKVINPIHAATIYVKFLQLFDSANASKLVMKGTPQGAAGDVQRISNGIAETDGFTNPKPNEPTHEKLMVLSKRIKSITPTIWKRLIKIIDNLFDSKDGSDTLAQLADTKSNLSEQQVKTIIQQQNEMPDENQPLSEQKVRSSTPLKKPLPPNPHSNTPPKKSLPQLPTKKYLPSRAPILKNILESLLAIEHSLGNPKRKEIHEKETSKIKNIRTHLTPELKNDGLFSAITTILKLLGNEKIGDNEKNRCLEYFRKLATEDKSEIECGNKIANMLQVASSKQLLGDLQNLSKNPPQKENNVQTSGSGNNASNNGLLWGNSKNAEDLMKKLKNMNNSL